jgi:hypothetical protein
MLHLAPPMTRCPNRQRPSTPLDIISPTGGHIRPPTERDDGWDVECDDESLWDAQPINSMSQMMQEFLESLSAYAVVWQNS